MKKRSIAPASTQKGRLEEVLATLIASTLRKHRPLSINEVADHIDFASDQIGSVPALAERIGISSKMLQQFRSIRRLDPMVQQLFQARRLDSVDAAVHLAQLLPSVQGTVAENLVARNIDTKDLRAIVDLHRRRPNAKIGALIEQVRRSKSVRHYVAEFVMRGRSTKDELRRRFSAHIPMDEIIDITVVGSIGRLVLTAKGRRSLSNAAEKLGVTLQQVIPVILQTR